MITLRDGARVALRPIAPEDAPLIAASFERLSKESRYRRLFTHKDALDPDELAYLVDVDHQNHEAIIAVDPSNSEALGVARYIRSEATRRSPRSRSPSPTTGSGVGWAARCSYAWPTARDAKASTGSAHSS